MTSLKFDKLSEEKFKPYGRLLNPKKGEKPEVVEPDLFTFYVTFVNSSSGWQIGFLNLTGTEIDKLERHPNTPEVFSPLSGESVIFVSTDPDPESNIRAFSLDKPLVLNEGVWHNVITISPKSEILIVENTNVEDDFHSLQNKLSVNR